MAEAATLERSQREIADLEEMWLLDAVSPPGRNVAVLPESSQNTLVDVPDVIRVQDLEEEANVQRDYARELGAIPVGQVIERPEASTTDRIVSLVSMVEHAKHGDKEALEENFRLALIEALLGEGYAGEIEIERDAEGFLHQNGHRLYDVLANTLQFHPGNHPKLHEIAQTEALGYYVFDMLDKAGYFDQGYVWVVPSMAPTDAPAHAVREYGYFENIAMIWRTIHKDPASGKFKMRSMFIAGATPYDYEEPGDRPMTPDELDQMYANRLDRRHDIRIATEVYRKEGLAVPTTIPGFLRGYLKKIDSFKRSDHPEADLAEMSDDILGPEYWLGRLGERKDYVQDGELRAVALERLLVKRPEMVQELIAEVEGVTDDMAIGHAIAQIVKRCVVDFMIDNWAEREIIGTQVLGRATTQLLNRYDALMLMGDFAGAGSLRGEIHATARTNMCGYGSGGSKKGGDDSNSTQRTDARSDDDGGNANGGRERCEITVDTCFCSLLHSDGTPRRTPMTVTAEYDNDGTVHCFRCKAFVTEADQYGNVKTFVGYIAKRAERRKYLADAALNNQVEEPKKQRPAYALAG